MPADPQPELPLGGAGHFVVRFTPREYRDTVAAAFAYAADLDDNVARCTDPGVTRLKLDWWRRELEAAKHSRHPLIRRLLPLASKDLGLAAMQAMLDAAEADVLKQQPDDIPAFHTQCEQAGALATLLCLACGHDNADAVPLGRYAAAVMRIQNLGRRLQRDHQPLPRQLALPADSSNWDAEQLADTCRSLLVPLRKDAESVMQERAADTLPARRWTNQARAVHRLLERDGYPVNRMYLDITPLGRLWSAWRVR